MLETPIKSTTHSGQEIIQDKLQLYYDVANPKCNNSSLGYNQLYNLGQNENYLIPASGSAAKIDALIYETDFYGRLRHEYDGFEDIPGIIDMAAGSTPFTIQIVMNPKTLSTIDPSNDNYILKSESDYGLFVKYLDPGGANPTELKFGVPNNSVSYVSLLDSRSSDDIFVYTIVFDGGTFYTYVGNGPDNDFQLNIGDIGGTVELGGSFKVGYQFSSFYFYEFRLYNTNLTIDDIRYNNLQIFHRFGDDNIKRY